MSNALINTNDLDFEDIILDEKSCIFLFIILDRKFQIVQSLCIMFS